MRSSLLHGVAAAGDGPTERTGAALVPLRGPRCCDESNGFVVPAVGRVAVYSMGVFRLTVAHTKRCKPKLDLGITQVFLAVAGLAAGSKFLLRYRRGPSPTSASLVAYIVITLTVASALCW
jgi:hypothetical protein